MSTTTAAEIRNRAIAVIAALAPRLFESDAFIASRNEGAAAFRKRADSDPAAAFRWFQVRTTGDDSDVESSNGDVELHYVTLTIIVAYPQQSTRYGDGAALDRDDVMDQDRYQIEAAIGLDGAANFTPPHPDATWRGSTPTREEGATCDFLVITQRMSFLQLMPVAP